MNCLLTSIWHQEQKHPRRTGRSVGQTDRRVQRPLHSYRDLSIPRRCWHGVAGDLRKITILLVPIGLEVPGCAGTHRAAQYRQKSLGPFGGEHGRIAFLGWRSTLPFLLDAGIRTDRSHASVAARNGLCRSERRQHGGVLHFRRDLH